MDTPRRPGAFSPMFNATPSSPPSPRSRSTSMDDSGDDSSSVASGAVITTTTTSSSSAAGTVSSTISSTSGGGGGGANVGPGSVRRGPTPTQQQQPMLPSAATSSIYTSPRSNTSTPVLQNYSRPTITHVVSSDGSANNSINTLQPPAGTPTPRKTSPRNAGPLGSGLNLDNALGGGISRETLASGSSSGISSGGPSPGGSRLDLRTVGLHHHVHHHHHHKRNNSQGFFEPSLPTLTDSPVNITPVNQTGPGPVGFVPGGPLPVRNDSIAAGLNMPGLTPSQIAAAAAMQAQQSGGSAGSSHFRQRSATIPSPPPLQDGTRPKAGSGSSQQSVGSMPPASSSRKGSLAAASAMAPSSGIAGPSGIAAAGAASAAYAGQQLSPGLTSFADSGPAEKTRSKAERAKNIFSKSKQINIPNTREFERKDSRAGPLTAKLPSPGTAIFPKGINASTTSLADTLPASSGTSIYNMAANSSTSTLVPIERMKSDDSVVTTAAPKEKEKEKTYRTHIFSRPKKNKDKIDEIALSSAASTSKPVDPSAPQSIYSFAQSSPAPSQTTFSKTVTGLDLRHGGRKKKDEFDFSAAFGQPTTATGHFMGGTPLGYGGHGGHGYESALAGFGLHNMSSEDAWDFLKAKILVIFEGEDLRIPVEDLNRLVSVHMQRCIQRRSPAVIEDLRDLLDTGFSSLDMTLRRLQEDRLVPQLVDMWLFVFGTLLPYMQAVFLPLDLELRGHGTMTPAEAAEFWGVDYQQQKQRQQQRADDGTTGADISAVGTHPDDEMDVRKYVLLSFRDNIILPRHDALKQVFSRLSLESINVGLDSPLPPPNPHFGGSAGGSSGGSSSVGGGGRPGTASSLDPNQSSYNSQGSTLISHAATATTTAVSDSNRSRATSNTSSQAPELPTFSPTLPLHQRQLHQQYHGQSHGHGHAAGGGSGSNHPTLALLNQQAKSSQPDSSQVTETVGRVLQCMSVLVSVHSDDSAQDKMEDLTKTLKLNWLGRGRTGRNRKGLVGARVPRRATPVVG